MIDPDYCRMMARYNQWQNKAVMAIVARMEDAELTKDRGAFFGSILGTLNHLLWGDLRWMARLDGTSPETTPISESAERTPNKAEWARLRFLTDGRIREWARGLDAVDLVGDLEVTPSGASSSLTIPIQVGVIQLFNHQAHHRGQVHAMLTAAGHDPGVTDVPFLPKEI